MIGTEGGFMPKPVVVPQQPIGYNLDPAYFNFRHGQPALAFPGISGAGGRSR